jgi:hypothetical protein
MIPGEGSGFLRSHAGQQTQSNERVQARTLCRLQDRRCLFKRQRPRWPPVPADRSVDQRRDNPAHQVLSLSLTNRTGRTVVRLLQSPRSVRGRHLVERTPHILCRQVGERNGADTRKQWPQRVTIGLDGLGSSARQPRFEPVGNCVGDRIAVPRPDPSIQLRVERFQLAFTSVLVVPLTFLRIRVPPGPWPRETTPRHRPSRPF